MSDKKISIDSLVNTDHQFRSGSIHYFDPVIHNSNFGFWEYNTKTREVSWSKGFYHKLGYEPGDIECSYNFFIDHLLYHEDRNLFLNHYTSSIQIRLLTKKNGYKWFELTTGKYDTGPDHLRCGLLTDIHHQKIASLTASDDDFLYAETARIAKVGGWQLEAHSGIFYFSKEAFDIFDLQDQLPLTIGDVIIFFEPDQHQNIIDAIDGAVKNSSSFDLELLFKTAKNRVTWLKFKGVPVIDDFGRCIYVRGIFQQIEKAKKIDSSQQEKIDVLQDQNSRLQNFAFMVAHNLRSYTNNLNAVVTLHGQAQTEQEREETFQHIRSLSDSLGKTIEQMNELVKIQTETAKEKKTVYFESIFNQTVSALKFDIEQTQAKIEYDFSKCPFVSYIPAYIESIFQNLLTNALKYRSPERNPVIYCYTFEDNAEIYLVFKDNGAGIDLERYGDRVFGMYETFHENTDAKGIGLYITRNQVESLGGSIEIESKVNVGTTFTIKLG